MVNIPGTFFGAVQDAIDGVLVKLSGNLANTTELDVGVKATVSIPDLGGDIVRSIGRDALSGSAVVVWVESGFVAAAVHLAVNLARLESCGRSRSCEEEDNV